MALTSHNNQGRKKRVIALGIAAFVFGLLLWILWPAPRFVPSIKLPEGVTLADALREGKSAQAKGWSSNVFESAERMRFPAGTAGVIEGLRYRIHEAFGRTLCTAPKRPTCDFVTPRLTESFQIVDERYLLAKEFVWEVDPRAVQDDEFQWTFLMFVWGGTNQLRHARDRIPAIENGILKEGVFGMRLKWSLPDFGGVKTREYLATNRCAIIRDIKGVVKIVPIEYLKAYVDAGLVMLPTTD